MRTESINHNDNADVIITSSEHNRNPLSSAVDKPLPKSPYIVYKSQFSLTRSPGHATANKLALLIELYQVSQIHSNFDILPSANMRI